MAVFNRTIPLLSTPLTKAKTLNDPVSTPTRHCAVLGHLYQKMAENQTNRGAKLKGRIFADRSWNRSHCPQTGGSEAARTRSPEGCATKRNHPGCEFAGLPSPALHRAESYSRWYFQDTPG